MSELAGVLVLLCHVIVVCAIARYILLVTGIEVAQIGFLLVCLAGWSLVLGVMVLAF